MTVAWKPEGPPASGLAHRIDDEGILWIVFDGPGERINLLTRENLLELSRLLVEAGTRSDIRGILFTSAKPGMFIAGNFIAMSIIFIFCRSKIIPLQVWIFQV